MPDKQKTRQRTRQKQAAPDRDMRITELIWELESCLGRDDRVGALVAVTSLVYYPLTSAQRARIRWAITPSTYGEPVAEPVGEPVA